MDKTKPFGLVLPKRAQTLHPKKNSVFESDSDDEVPKKKVCTKIPQSIPLSKLTAKIEDCEDPSIYEYDSIYDDMKAQEVAKVEKKDDKPSRYIDSLLKAADKRKKEYERRIEKKVQIEREKEGDKYIDKDAFVTAAYKKKMQEMEQQEERERRENELNEMMDVTKQKDLSGFYRHFLNQSVGEEKMPEFGKTLEIKKEPQSDTEDNGNVAKRNVTQDNEPPQNIDCDSDIVSSSEEEMSPSNSHIESSSKRHIVKISRCPRKSADDNELGGKHSSKESEDTLIRKKKLSRNVSKRTDDVSSQSSSESESAPSDQKDEISATEPINGNSTNKQTKMNDAEESVVKKVEPKKNIFEKRTVGAIFAEAQAKYFQRMASRG